MFCRRIVETEMSAKYVTVTVSGVSEYVFVAVFQRFETALTVSPVPGFGLVGLGCVAVGSGTGAVVEGWVTGCVTGAVVSGASVGTSSSEGSST